MFKKYLSLLLMVSLFYAASAGPARASASPDGERRAEGLAAEVKAGILRLGTGEAARVKLKLRDKRRLEGYVSRAGEESFTVTDARTHAETVIPYGQVAQVKGNNLSTGQKVAIVTVIAVAAVLVVVATVKAIHFRL